jgi:putative transposase
MNRKAYSSDLTDAEWALLAPFIPPALPGGRPRSTEMREVLDAIFYILRGGCAWRLLPHEFPKWIDRLSLHADVAQGWPVGAHSRRAA